MLAWFSVAEMKENARIMAKASQWAGSKPAEPILCVADGDWLSLSVSHGGCILSLRAPAQVDAFGHVYMPCAEVLRKIMIYASAKQMEWALLDDRVRLYSYESGGKAIYQLCTAEGPPEATEMPRWCDGEPVDTKPLARLCGLLRGPSDRTVQVVDGVLSIEDEHLSASVKTDMEEDGAWRINKKLVDAWGKIDFMQVSVDNGALVLSGANAMLRLSDPLEPIRREPGELLDESGKARVKFGPARDGARVRLRRKSYGLVDEQAAMAMRKLKGDYRVFANAVERDGVYLRYKSQPFVNN